MKLKQPVKIKEIASIIGAEFIGDNQLHITGINEIHKVEKGDLTFVDFDKYYSRALTSEASAILIDKRVDCPNGKALLISPDPFRDYNKLTNHYMPFQTADRIISTTAVIDSTAIVQPGVFVGNNVVIGKNCIIHAHVTICDHSIIGDNVIIHPNTVIGSDGFYFKRRSDGKNGHYHDKLLSCGRVIIEDNVEIGAGCTIDRGASGDTIIGEGTKIDNLVHIGHGAVIGKNCLFAAQVGVAGKVHIGNNVTLWGQVGVSKDLTIGDGAIVLGKSGVDKSLEGGKIYFGAPVSEARAKWKEMAILKQLPEIWEKLKGLK